MIGGDLAEVEEFLNRFRLAAGYDTLGPKWRALFEEVLASGREPRMPGAVLPAPDGDQLRIYALAQDEREWRRLRPLLMAYAGATLTSFAGLPEPAVSGTALDQLVTDSGAEVIAVLNSPRHRWVHAMRALRRMVAALRGAPEGAARPPQPTSWLLARFQDSLNVGDRATAEALITQLRAENRLDALNLRFLEVQLLAGIGDWPELRALPTFDDLCRARKPASVAAALLEALYEADVADAFGSEDVELCLKRFAAIRALAGSMISLPPPANLGRGGWRLYALAALSAAPRRPALEEVVAGRPEIDWLAGCFAAPPDTVVPEPEPDPDSSLQALQSALTRLALLSKDEQARLFEAEPLRSLLGGATVPPDRHIPADWPDWLDSIRNPAFAAAFEIAQRGKDEWPLSLLSDPIAASQFAAQLDEAGSHPVAHERLAMALPLLVAWLQRDEAFPRPASKPVCASLLTLFGLGEVRNQGVLSSVTILADALLAIGMPVEEYRTVLSDLLDLAGDAVGTEGVYWILDLTEATLRHHCPDHSARESFWLAALARIEPVKQRLSPLQRAAIAEFGSLVGWIEDSFVQATATPESEDLERLLAGKQIAIYTLSESAARHAKEALEAAAPQVRIDLSADHVGSARLRALAENADLFVVTSLSAKHAATNFIRAHRQPSQPLLWAGGKGFSSILKAVEDHLRGIC